MIEQHMQVYTDAVRDCGYEAVVVRRRLHL